MPITLACNAMGTRFELVLAGDDALRLRPIGEAALAEIEDCHRRYNLFDPGSWLNTINRRAADELVALDDMTFELLRTCIEVHQASGGAFDVTVAPLMHAWGFHSPSNQPDPDAIRTARETVGMQHVLLDSASRTVRFTRPGVTLDLGGIAKGFAIDQATARLREEGATCALLHGGTSTVAAIGSPPESSGWRVELSTPNTLTNQAHPVVMLNDESLSVSAPQGRTIESGDATRGHVLDPRTGEPAACGAFAAAVGKSACLTDAWATALLVLGHAPADMPGALRVILPEPHNLSSTPAMPLEAMTP